MSAQSHDSPYADLAAPKAAPSRDHSSRPARKSRRKRSGSSARQSQPEAPVNQRSQSRPQQQPPRSHSRGPVVSRSRSPAPHPPRQHREPAVAKAAAPKSGRSRSRSGRKGRGGNGPSQLTSQPTGRVAYAETRAWLLKEHGPVCAYCDRKFTAKVMTLDHVAPRRGQSAYDRRDNLVLACPGCNMIKRDMAPLAFLLASRSRAASLLRYGSHLSPMLLDLARQLVTTDASRAATGNGNGNGHAAAAKAVEDWAGLGDLPEGESPYAD